MQIALHARTRPNAERDPRQIATHADSDPCRSRPQGLRSVVRTPTPAPKGRNSLAQGVSPGTRPAKSRAPEGRQPVHPPTSTSSPHTNIDTHKYRYPSI